MSLKRATAAGIAMVLGLVREAEAGAWPMAPGDGQVIVTGFYTVSDGLSEVNPEIVPTDSQDRFLYNAFVEYGLTEHVTAVGSLSFVHVDLENGTDDSRSGLDFVELGPRVLLTRWGSAVLSAQGTVRIPFADESDGPAAIGSTQNEADVRLLGGYGFELFGMRSFAELQAGYRFRFDDPPNEIRVDATIGIRPIPDLEVQAQAFTVIADGSAEGVFSNSRYTNGQLSVIYDVNETWSVQAGVNRTILHNDFIPETTGLVALWYRW